MDNQNFLSAVVISILILVGFHFLYEKPQLEKAERRVSLEKVNKVTTPKVDEVLVAPVSLRDRAAVLAETQRIAIDTPEFSGSINLTGARIDDLRLKKYHETIDKSSPTITLLSPAGSKAPHKSYFTSFGWLAAKGIDVPADKTVWSSSSSMLGVDKPVVLSWRSAQGLVFEREISVDKDFLFTITDRVKNAGKETVTLYPFGLVSRQGHPPVMDTFVMHEGPIGVLGGTLQEIKYDDVKEEGKMAFESDEGGWLGITDKYWLVSLLPAQGQKLVAHFSYEAGTAPGLEEGIYQADFRATPISLAPGANGSWTTNLFAGAKRVSLLDKYENQLNLPLFDRAIDFGWYYYLTKPFLYLLDEISSLTGQMWVAILIFTFLLKIVTLPLSVKSMKSMAKMKALQPEMKKIQERYKEDKQKLSLATMELYQRERVNPMSGCMPIIIQIPIFFALYKVLYVGIEMRHAPLFGWVKDMSAPDPSSVFTLFGAVDWSFMPHVGVWPILMGLSMFAQQKMSPTPPDKTQAQIFLLMPIIFTFMLSSFAVGLIFYWTVSNVLGIAQQWYISRHVKTGVGTK